MILFRLRIQIWLFTLCFTIHTPWVLKEKHNWIANVMRTHTQENSTTYELDIILFFGILSFNLFRPKPRKRWYNHNSTRFVQP